MTPADEAIVPLPEDFRVTVRDADRLTLPTWWREGRRMLACWLRRLASAVDPWPRFVIVSPTPLDGYAELLDRWKANHAGKIQPLLIVGDGAP